jgi:tRNA-dihydrouridine synthase
MKSSFKYVCFICASLFVAQVYAADMSGWSDKTVCRLAKATADNTEYQTELTKRSLICGGQASSSSVKSNNKLLPNGLKQIKVIEDFLRH